MEPFWVDIEWSARPEPTTTILRVKHSTSRVTVVINSRLQLTQSTTSSWTKPTQLKMSQTNKNVLIRPNNFIEAKTIEYLRRCSINCAEQPLKMSRGRTLLLRQAVFYFYLCCAVAKGLSEFCRCSYRCWCPNLSTIKADSHQTSLFFNSISFQ